VSVLGSGRKRGAQLIQVSQTVLDQGLEEDSLIDRLGIELVIERTMFLVESLQEGAIKVETAPFAVAGCGWLASHLVAVEALT
jgi:hypothetical protein